MGGPQFFLNTFLFGFGMQTRTALLSLVGLLSLALAGCNDGAVGSAPKVKTYKATGKVTMNGAAVASAMVTFSPSGQQPAATARTDNDGKFALTTYDPGDGAAEGEYKVMVTKEGAPANAGPVGHDPNKPPSGSAMHSARQATGGSAAAAGLLPAKYNSSTTTDLNATISNSAANDFTFDLKP